MVVGSEKVFVVILRFHEPRVKVEELFGSEKKVILKLYDPRKSKNFLGFICMWRLQTCKKK